MTPVGTWTVGSFSDLLDELELWPIPHVWPSVKPWRRWSFEAAALDLALTQARTNLYEVLDIEPKPVDFVHSPSLVNQDIQELVVARLASTPSIRFKLDVTRSWDGNTVSLLRELGVVDVFDFKSRYLTRPADVETTEFAAKLASVFPEVIFEDPPESGRISSALTKNLVPVSYDAGITSYKQLETLPNRPAAINVKPCRFGSLANLFSFYSDAFADSESGLLYYGGGMDELGVGRTQLNILASIFHPSSPNDVAPSPYNAAPFPSELPSTPTYPDPSKPGFS